MGGGSHDHLNASILAQQGSRTWGCNPKAPEPEQIKVPLGFAGWRLALVRTLGVREITYMLMLITDHEERQLQGPAKPRL